MTSPAPDLLARARDAAAALNESALQSESCLATDGFDQHQFNGTLRGHARNAADILAQLLARCEAAEAEVKRLRDGLENHRAEWCSTCAGRGQTDNRICLDCVGKGHRAVSWVDALLKAAS